MMQNKFNVTNCRFHARDEYKLLIQGWFENETEDDHQLSVYLDDKNLDIEIEKNTDVAAAQQCAAGEQAVRYRYFVWIMLPENWKTCKVLRLTNKGEKQLLKQNFFSISVSKLIKINNKLDKYIDGGVVQENGFRISGWCLCVEKVDIFLFDENNKLLEYELKRKRRGDVLLQYPECTSQDILCFDIIYRGMIPKRVKIVMSTERKKAEYEYTIRRSKASEIKRQLIKCIKKVWKHYKDRGITDTINWGIGKLTKRESGSYMQWLKSHQPSPKVLQEQRVHTFAYAPLISIVVPLYKTPEKYLNELIDSIEKQTYENWELCLSDGSGAESSIKRLLETYQKKDPRIKITFSPISLKISENTNHALGIATGEWIAFADHDDMLAPNALYACVSMMNDKQNMDALYTDEDKVTMDGTEYFQAHFKPDFNIDMLRSVNYFCHLFLVKKELLDEVGRLDPEFDGAQDYDFVLRCAEKATCIGHVPQVLYHWRAHKDSTAENPESKRYAFEAGKRAIEAHYKRVGIHAEVKSTNVDGIYRSKYILEDKPLVSVIIPNKDHTEDLDKCIRPIEEKGTYDNIEYIIIENNSEKEDTFKYYERIQKENPKIKVVIWDKEFNYSAINNYGVQYAQGEYYLFLNNDTEIINADCIEELMGYCMRGDVGIVGARLYYEDDTIQHAGVIVGLGGVAGHAFPGMAHDDPGYFGRIITTQDYSAVTAACMMVKKKVFEEVGGFETKLAVAFNDIDFCLKVREAGYLVVYNPFAELHHYESKSRGLEDTKEKIMRFQHEIETFQEKWSEFLLKGDPYYNPNLTLDKNDFSLR